jgi:chaperone modulatory protein CbpM
MTSTKLIFIQGSVVEETVHLSLVELCHACGAEQDQVLAWVDLGVLAPVGQMQQEWRFGGDSLRRARRAYRLWHDLEINAPGVALALDLLDEIALLRRHERVR